MTINECLVDMSCERCNSKNLTDACDIDRDSDYLVFCMGCKNFLEAYEVKNKDGLDLLDALGAYDEDED